MRGRVPRAALSATLLAALLRPSASAAADPRDPAYDPAHPDAYDPDDAAHLDLDQRTLVGRLSLGTAGGLDAAARIYAEGGYSGPCADVTFGGGLAADVGRGTALRGNSAGGDDVFLTVLEDAAAGSTRLRVAYDVGRSLGWCRVGGSPTPDLSGCLAASGNIYAVDAAGGNAYPYVYPYAYAPLADNYNARTLAGLGARAREEHAGAPTFRKFVAYYGESDYADEWIRAAFGGASTFFRNGNPDFGRFDLEGRAAAVQFGTVVLNLWMYVMGLVEGAVAGCVPWGADGVVNPEGRRALDEARALYMGSQSENTADGGYLLHAVAQHGCARFGTCTGGDGFAAASAGILRAFEEARGHLADGKCASVAGGRDRLRSLMTVPLVQGVLQRAHALDRHGDHQMAIQGQGAAFAAALLPLVDTCSQSGALTIYNDLTPGRGTIGSYDVVRFALERSYGCLGITCEDVGGLLDPTGNGYYAGAGPCNPADTKVVVPEIPDTNNMMKPEIPDRDDDDFALPSTRYSDDDAAVWASASSSNDAANTAATESSFESYGSTIGWLEGAALAVVVFGVLVAVALLRKRKRRGRQEEDPAAASTDTALPEVPEQVLEKDKAIV